MPRSTRSLYRGHSHVHALVAYSKEIALIRRHVKKHIAFREAHTHTQRHTVQEIVPATANENRRALADSCGFRKISKGNEEFPRFHVIKVGHVFLRQT